MSENKNKYFIVSQVVAAPTKTAAALAVSPRRSTKNSVTTVAVDYIKAPQAHALIEAVS